MTPPSAGESLTCAEFDRRAALTAVDSCGVELGNSRVDSTTTPRRRQQGRRTELHDDGVGADVVACAAQALDLLKRQAYYNPNLR